MGSDVCCERRAVHDLGRADSGRAVLPGCHQERQDIRTLDEPLYTQKGHPQTLQATVAEAQVEGRFHLHERFGAGYRADMELRLPTSGSAVADATGTRTQGYNVRDMVLHGSTAVATLASSSPMHSINS